MAEREVLSDLSSGGDAMDVTRHSSEWTPACSDCGVANALRADLRAMRDLNVVLDEERSAIRRQLRGAVEALRAFALDDADFKVFAIEGGPVYVPVTREQAEAIRAIVGGQSETRGAVDEEDLSARS